METTCGLCINLYGMDNWIEQVGGELGARKVQYSVPAQQLTYIIIIIFGWFFIYLFFTLSIALKNFPIVSYRTVSYHKRYSAPWVVVLLGNGYASLSV